MAVTVGIGMALVTLLISIFFLWKRTCNKMPPGPTPLPIIGNFHQIGDSSMALDITNLGKKYGDIFTVHFFMKPVLIINSYKIIAELLGSPKYSDIFSGRVFNYFSKFLLPDDLIFQTATVQQHYMRRLVKRGIKQYGTFPEHLEHIFQDELKKWIERAQEKKGVAFDPMEDIIQYLSSIIMILVCGESFPPNHRMMQLAREAAEDFEYLLNFKRQILMDTVPFATMVHPNLRKACERMLDNNNHFAEYFTKMRKERTNNHEDCLFAILEKEYEEGKINFNNVKGIIIDTIIAGIFTIAPTIYTTLLALVLFPEVQKNIQEEIDRVVGTHRLLSFDDKKKLPYCKAAMLEIFRYFTPSRLPAPRSTVDDCNYNGYVIPKGIYVMYNAWQVHHDERFWEEPFKFDPTRFLDSNGRLLPSNHERRKRLLTFGIGKRSCVGALLARLRIFLAMTTILQHFDLKKDPTLPLPSSDPRTYHVKFMTIPPAYKIRFVPRH